MQGKRLEKLGENTGQILRGRKNDPPTPLQLATNRHRAGLPSLVQKNGPSAGLHAEAVGGCVSGTPKTLVNNTVDCHVSKIPIRVSGTTGPGCPHSSAAHPSQRDSAGPKPYFESLGTQVDIPG